MKHLDLFDGSFPRALGADAPLTPTSARKIRIVCQLSESAMSVFPHCPPCAPFCRAHLSDASVYRRHTTPDKSGTNAYITSGNSTFWYSPALSFLTKQRDSQRMSIDIAEERPRLFNVLNFHTSHTYIHTLSIFLPHIYIYIYMAVFAGTFLCVSFCNYKKRRCAHTTKRSFQCRYASLLELRTSIGDIATPIAASFRQGTIQP